ncbi:MAG: B12-binding domain-containing radical SAM protein [Deltaproteobacteria bacterium]|nr:MAG: B12-binding domain-containing radical SAM protein [Deltaproteobacteria bacterium]
MKVVFVYKGSESLGIEYLSSFLKNKGHQTELVFDPAVFSSDRGRDSKFLARMFRNYQDKVIEKVISANPDLIAFSAYTANYRWSLDLAQKIKDKKRIPIVFGGIHTTAVPQRVIQNECIDAVVVGEGEYPLLELVESLENGIFNDLRIRNVYFKKNNDIITNPVRPYIHDIDELPLPNKELFYQKVPALEEVFLIMTSRGCPLKCSYCCNNIFHRLYSSEKRHFRRRSVTNVISELRLYKKRGRMQAVAFWDDIFTIDSKWISEFSEQYSREIGLPFYCYSLPNTLSREIVKLLANANCRHIKIGVQTVSEETHRKILHRPGSKDSISKAALLLREYGIQYSTDHILNLPFEGVEEQEKAAEFYNKIRPVRINSHWMTYYPGTEIIETARKGNIISRENTEKMEEGYYCTPYNFPSVKKNGAMREVAQIQILFDLIPLLPRILCQWLIRKKIYRYFFYSSFLHQTLIGITSLAYRDKEYWNTIKYIFTPKGVP